MQSSGHDLLWSTEIYRSELPSRCFRTQTGDFFKIFIKFKVCLFIWKQTELVGSNNKAYSSRGWDFPAPLALRFRGWSGLFGEESWNQKGNGTIGEERSRHVAVWLRPVVWCWWYTAGHLLATATSTPAAFIINFRARSVRSGSEIHPTENRGDKEEITAMQVQGSLLLPACWGCPSLGNDP